MSETALHYPNFQLHLFRGFFEKQVWQRYGKRGTDLVAASYEYLTMLAEKEGLVSSVKIKFGKDQGIGMEVLQLHTPAGVLVYQLYICLYKNELEHLHPLSTTSHDLFMTLGCPVRADDDPLRQYLLRVPPEYRAHLDALDTDRQPRNPLLLDGLLSPPLNRSFKIAAPGKKCSTVVQISHFNIKDNS